jgi:hypothetical protein
MLPANLLIPAIVAAVLFAFAVGWQANDWRRDAQSDRTYREERQAADKAQADKDRQVATTMEAYREELERTRTLVPKRVLYCPAARLPATPGGTDGADPGAADPVDLGPLLREALTELQRCNALRKAIP